jgi:hypothetical protein
MTSSPTLPSGTSGPVSGWSNPTTGELRRDPILTANPSKSPLESAQKRAQRVGQLLKLWRLQLLLLRSSATRLNRYSSMRSESKANDADPAKVVQGRFVGAVPQPNMSSSRLESLESASQLNRVESSRVEMAPSNNDSTVIQIDSMLDVLSEHLLRIESNLRSNRTDRTNPVDVDEDTVDVESTSITTLIETTENGGESGGGLSTITPISSIANEQSSTTDDESNFNETTMATIAKITNNNQSRPKVTGNRRNKRNRTRNKRKGQRRKTSATNGNAKSPSQR